MAQTTQEPLGKAEQMLVDMIDGKPIVESPDDKIQGLLMELAQVIAEGGGGGGGGDVTGVKGSAESTYRKGNVNLTAENIGVEAGAEVNTIESITLNGTELTPDANKNVVITVITNAVDNLLNYYLKSETYTKTEVDNIINTVKNGRFKAVPELPTTDIETNVIYLVPKSTAQTDNIKDEYINLDGTTSGWEKIGDTEIDLSDYVTITALNTALANYTTTADLTSLLADKVSKSDTAGLLKNDGTVDTTTYATKASVDAIKDGQSIDSFADAETALAGKADTDDVINSAVYDSANHLILFKNGTTTLFSLDAAAFVKDGMVDTVTITGGNLVITFNTDAGKQAISIPLTDIFDPANYYNKDDVDGLLAPKADQTEVNDIVNVYGAKNLMETTASSHTQNGITKTVNADGSFTLNGTATKNTYFYWIGQTQFPTENIQYTYSIETSAVWGIGQAIAGIDKRSETAYIDRYKSLFADGTTHIEGTFTGESGYYAWAWIFIPNGTQLTNVIVKGMIRLASIKDDTFVPYAKTNGALTIDKAEQAEVNDIVNVLGAKNLLPIILSTQTENGVTVTVNKDSSDNVLSVVLNGTATSSGQFNLNNTSGLLNSLLQKYGDLIWSGCPSRNDCRMYTHIQNGSYVTLTNGEEKILSASNNYDANILVQYDNEVTYNNVAFYPMLRLASDPDDTYQPYAMTNREMTEMVGRTVNYPLEWNSDLNLDTNKGGQLYKYGKIYLISYWFKATTDISGNTPILKLPKNGLVNGNYVIAVNNDVAVWGGKAQKDGNDYVSISCPIVTGNMYRAQCVFIDPS